MIAISFTEAFFASLMLQNPQENLLLYGTSSILNYFIESWTRLDSQ